MSVDIGSYKSRAVIQRKGYTSNDFGGFALTWSDVDTIWCRVEQLSSKEKFEFKQIYPTAQYKIYIRYRPDIKSDMRLNYGQKYLGITGIIDIDNLHEELIILCEVLQSEQ